jgi:hypothetical protein
LSTACSSGGRSPSLRAPAEQDRGSAGRPDDDDDDDGVELERDAIERALRVLGSTRRRAAQLPGTVSA